jgi:hypothetical protein
MKALLVAASETTLLQYPSPVIPKGEDDSLYMWGSAATLCVRVSKRQPQTPSDVRPFLVATFLRVRTWDMADEISGPSFRSVHSRWDTEMLTFNKVH